MNTSHATVTREQRNRFLNKISNGSITLDDEKELLRHILNGVYELQYYENRDATPIFENLQETEKKILAYFTEGEHGFDNWGSIGTNNIYIFSDKYETPIDFQDDRERFLDRIERFNGHEKRIKYEGAMRGLENAIFGKQQEYWIQMQKLNDEADKLSRRTKEMGRVTARLYQETAELTTNNPGEIYREGWEPALGQLSERQVSRMSQSTSKRPSFLSNFFRAQTDNSFSDKDLEEVDSFCEDSALLDEENCLYGVFDGAGGMGNARDASQVARQSISDYIKGNNVTDQYDLEKVLEQANGSVCGTGGYTTAVLVKVEFNAQEKKIMHWASVGDSRIYLIRGKEAIQITRDEGNGSKITNALGVGRFRCQQANELTLQAGDKIVLCSDGITGDKGDELLSDEEVYKAVAGAQSSDDAVKRLVNAARKIDDRTAIVFGV
ncbi:MAG: SpoIIE family protein phosphatase [Candidatus Saccharibacteria bacterium]|nr:SpoIIE family protein phosphatase [Candidatus Saccharibacteria bacterium]